MVTSIVIRITPAERASAAEDLNRDDGNDDQLHHKKRCDDFDDGEGDYKYDAENYGEKICVTKAADGGFCDDHSRNDVPSHCKPSDDARKDEGTAVNIRRHNNNTSNKRPLLLEDDEEDNREKKRRRKRPNVIDLADVPPLSPILRSGIKDGASKYQGVSFNKATNKWWARISVDGKTHYIGLYDNEEEAAIDYARAAYKYKAGQKFIDLTDVPPQSPIKSKRSDGSSKYQGVTFNKTLNKWRARISVDGKQHLIGYYDNEEEAAIDYARAAYKYKAGITTSRASLLATGSVAIPITLSHRQRGYPKKRW